MTILLLITSLVFLALLVVISLIAKAQYQRAEKCEQVIKQYEKILLDFGEDVLNTYNHIKNIDNRQLFEKDDDVGTTFQDILDIIEKFNERTQSYRVEK